MYIFQAWFNEQQGWVNIPPLSTDDTDEIGKTITNCLRESEVGFLWRVLQTGYIIATNTQRAFDK